jgi:hypothetical protein
MGSLVAVAVHDMPWYAILLPAAITALVIRADAVWRGPYWTFLDLIDALERDRSDPSGEDRGQLRFAVARRYAYVAVAAVVMSVLQDEWSALDSAILGAVIAGLLLWPLFFHGLPYGVLPSDWQLIPWYLGVVASFVSACVMGSIVVAYVDAQSGGESLEWLKDEALQFGFTALVLFVASAFSRGSLQSLRVRRSAREKEWAGEDEWTGEDEWPGEGEQPGEDGP